MNNSRHPWYHPARRNKVAFRIASILGIFAAHVSAQNIGQTQTTSSAASTNDDALELSPFLVTTEQDPGYEATNTLAGTRLNTDIANTPVALSVLTRGFLNDIGATDGNRAMEYALNASNDTNDATGNAAAWNPFQYKMRGFSGATNSRNYFRSEFLSEGYNVDYLEMARGPNSVLFGIASPGGTYNAAIKRARPGQTVTSFQARVGSFNEYRGTLDIARTLDAKKRFALRLNLLEHQSDGYFDFERTERRAATLALTWRPFRSTAVRFEAEHGRFFDNKARPFPLGNRYRDWVNAGRVLQSTPTARPANTSAMFASASGNGIYFFPQSDVGALPVAFSGNYFRTSTSTQVRGGLSSDAPSVLDTSVVPRTANLLGPGNGNTSNQTIAGLFVEQRVGQKLFIEAAYYYQGRDYINRMPESFNDNDLYIDVSANVPMFDANGNLTGYKSNSQVGRYLTRGVYQEQTLDDNQNNFRLTGSYELDLGVFGKHRLAALGQRTRSTRDNSMYREGNRSPNRQYIQLTDTRNAIIRVNYLDFGSDDESLRGIHDRLAQPIRGKLQGASAYEVESGLIRVSRSGYIGTVDSAIAATQSSFWKERLWLTGGIRRDVVRNKSATAFRDPTTLEYTGIAYNQPRDLNVGDTTGSYGVAFHAFPWLTIYGNRSDNFNTQGNAVLFGETGANRIAGNTKGEGQDVGIRSKLFNGRLNFSAGYYKTEQVGQYFYVAGTYAGAINNIWSALGESRPLLSGNDLQDLTGEGVEFELTANPTRNLRLTFNYAKTNRFGQTREYKSLRSYMGAYQSTWLSADNASKPVTSSYGSTVQEVWNTLQRQLALDTETNGRMPFAFRPESANGFARYDFRDGWLKGLAVGGGVNWRGPMVIAYRYGDAKQQVRGYEQIFVNGLLSYERKLSKTVTATFQLNVDNLLDFDDPYPRRVYWYDDAAGPSYTYQYPYQVRRWSLTTTLRF